MSFKIKTLHGAALAVSLTATAFSIVTVIALSVPMLAALLIPIGTAVVCYLAACYFMHQFLLFRIKPVYQIIHSKKNKHPQLSPPKQSVDAIDEQIHQWAESRELEIQRLQENETYRKEFLRDLSHEIKTPIFTLQGYILTLLDGGLEDEQINRKYLERSERNINRLIDMIRDIESLAKLESGELTLEEERFDMVALVREIAESMEMEALKRNIRIDVGESTQQPPVYLFADRRSIAQVLVNLLSNSLKYGTDGGYTRIRFIDIFDRVMIEVADNGVGIPEESIERIFERFYRVDKSRSREQGGTGLGLSIVKHILEAHGQNITARSKPEEGTVFSFTLPKQPTK